MIIANLVKNKRLELKETQVAFGRRFGLSGPSISMIESGRVRSITEDILSFVLPPIYQGKTEYEIKAEVIYDMITSGELDRKESIATIALNIEKAKEK